MVRITGHVLCLLCFEHPLCCAVGACCAQILYMKQTLLDYGVVLDKVPLLCDNESAAVSFLLCFEHPLCSSIDRGSIQSSS